MQMLDIIMKKRDGNKLTNEEIEFVIKNYTDSKIPDYQMSSFLMACYLKGMDNEEASTMALEMAKSGDMLDLSGIKGIKVDKHSTGGVGDKVTLVLGPLVSSLGAKFAKMSGRGLGHTGGTIDKLESIPNFQVEISPEDFIKQVNEIGLAVVGQTGKIAPADKKIYALRDVTATVECNALIASSIMSKKLASGSDCICLDIKVGNGAFMKNIESAETLGKLMIEIGKSQGRKVSAFLTNMDEPLGHMIGNSLEVYEAIETLKGNGPKDLLNVCLEIGAELLVNAKIENDFNAAKKHLLENIYNGKALDKLRQMIIYQHGDDKVIDDPEKLINSEVYEYKAKVNGFIKGFNTIKIGEAARLLGAGRLTKEDKLDYFTGISLDKKIGEKVVKNQTILKIYHNKKGLEEAIKVLDSAIFYSDNKVEKPTLIDKILR